MGVQFFKKEKCDITIKYYSYKYIGIIPFPQYIAQQYFQKYYILCALALLPV